MKKIFIVFLAVIMLFTLTACGNENGGNYSNNNNGNSQNDIIEDNNKEEPKKEEEQPAPQYDDYIDDDEIIDRDDSGNLPPGNEGPVVVEKVINCDGCVYAYFNKEGNEAVRIGDTLSSSDYTTDINNLKTGGGKQRHNFFGLVLSDNKISKAYACILKDSKIYCIQGSSNGEYHNNNIGVLNQVYTSEQCKTISDGHTYTCTDGSYNGDTKTTGYVSFLYETGCTIYGGNSSNVGKLICH